MKTPVNRTTLKGHFTYNWWKYLLIVVVAVFAVEMLYTTTAYRPPRDKTVSVYVYGYHGYLGESAMDDYLENVRQAEMSDMELIRYQMVLTDETYGPMQLLATLAAGEADLYLLPREQFLSYASEGSLVRLDEDKDLLELFDSNGISLQTGWRRERETGENHLYGIPQSKLPGLSQYIWADDGYLCIVVNSGNMENALKLLRIICRDTIPEPPEPAPTPIVSK